MAVQLNSYRDKKPKQVRTGAGKGKVFMRVIVTIGVAVFVALCLFGVINQRKLVETTVQTSNEAGKEVGEGMMDVLSNDDDSPVDITDQGIYLKGHTPDDANSIVQEKNAEEMQKEMEEAQKAAEEEAKKKQEEQNNQE